MNALRRLASAAIALCSFVLVQSAPTVAVAAVLQETASFTSTQILQAANRVGQTIVYTSASGWQHSGSVWPTVTDLRILLDSSPDLSPSIRVSIEAAISNNRRPAAGDLIKLIESARRYAKTLSAPTPTPTPTGSTLFAAFGDIGNTSGSAAVASLTRARSAQFILMLGDICYGSQPFADQVNANYSAERAAGKLRPALGNHEYNDACGGWSGASAYRAYFTLPNNERYYDFVKGPVHFFAINSYNEPDGMTATSKQGLWLKAKMAASTSPWKVVFFHHPPFSSGYHRSTSYMQWPFEAWGAHAVLSGHDHNYERFSFDKNADGKKIPYIVSGLGGKSRRAFGTAVPGSVKRYNAADGALFVTATSTTMKFEFRNVSGTVIDTLSLTTTAPTQSDPAFEFRIVPEE